MKDRLSRLLTIFIWGVIAALMVKCVLVYLAFKETSDPQLFADLQTYGFITVGIVLVACIIRGFVRRMK